MLLTTETAGGCGSLPAVQPSIFAAGSGHAYPWISLPTLGKALPTRIQPDSEFDVSLSTLFLAKHLETLSFDPAKRLAAAGPFGVIEALLDDCVTQYAPTSRKIMGLSLGLFPNLENVFPDEVVVDADAALGISVDIQGVYDLARATAAFEWEVRGATQTILHTLHEFSCNGLSILCPNTLVGWAEDWYFHGSLDDAEYLDMLRNDGGQVDEDVFRPSELIKSFGKHFRVKSSEYKPLSSATLLKRAKRVPKRWQPAVNALARCQAFAEEGVHIPYVRSVVEAEAEPPFPFGVLIGETGVHPAMRLMDDWYHWWQQDSTIEWASLLPFHLSNPRGAARAVKKLVRALQYIEAVCELVDILDHME
jgi:hypothetical protein